MNSQRNALRVAAFLFTLFGLAHLVRLFKHIPVAFGTFHVPFVVSWVALIVAAILSSWIWRLSSK